MKKLFEPVTIKNVTAKNRIGLPPMVCFNWTGDDGYITDKSMRHYKEIAKGGVGLIVTEAFGIDPKAKVNNCAAGLWEDDQIDCVAKIVDAVHQENVPIILQILHPGLVGYGSLVPPKDYLPKTLEVYADENGKTLKTKGPSAYSCEFPFDGLRREVEPLSIDEIHEIQVKFTDACVRAHKAGADGVELHGCHFYLISQFMNTRINKRTDAYGKTPSKFLTELIHMVRQAVGPDFIIGVRLGIFEPTLQDGVDNAKAVEQAGADYLHMSFGFMTESDMEKPSEYPFNEFIYGAQVIKENTSIPVFAVNGIDSPELAEAILERTDVDMCFVGTGHLINYQWATDARLGKDVGRCLHCSYCMWRANPDRCPGVKKFKKDKSEQ